MRSEHPKNRPHRKTWPKILTFSLATAALLILLLLLLTPVYLSSATGRQLVLDRINSSLDGKADFADFSIGWLKGIKVVDFSFNDGAGRIAVRIKQIITKPHYLSLLFGSPAFGKTIIDRPDVQLTVKTEPDGRSSHNNKHETFTLPVERINLTINDGSLKVTNAAERSMQISNINSQVNLRPPGDKTDFNIDMLVARAETPSAIKASGQLKTAGTKKGWSLKGTSGDLTVEVKDLDLESIGPLLELAGVKFQADGMLSADMKGQILDGEIQKLTANVAGSNMEVTTDRLKTDHLKSDSLSAAIDLEKKEKLISINRLNIGTDWAAISANGTVPTTLDSFADFLKPDAGYTLKADFDCDLAAVLSQLPNTLKLKKDTQVTSGRLSGNLRTLTSAGKRQIQAQATLADLQGTVQGKRAALSQPLRADALICSDKNTVSFDKLNILASFAQIDCTGTTESLQYTAAADLTKLQAELGQFIDVSDYRLSGRLSETGRLSITQDKLTAAGTSTIRDLQISSPNAPTISEPAADIDFDLALDRKADTILINNLRLKANLGQLAINDGVLPLSSTGATASTLTASAENIDLRRLNPFLIAFASFPKEMQLSGIAHSNITLSTADGIYKIASDATQIKDLRVVHPEKEPFEQQQVRMTFDAEVDTKEKTVNVKTLQLDSPQIKIKKAELRHTRQAEKTELKGRLECQYDWGALSTLTAPLLPRGFTLYGQKTSTIDFLCRYPTGQTAQILPNLTARANLAFEKAEYMGLHFGPTDPNARIQNGVLNIGPFSTTVNQGRLSFAGRADFKKKPTILTTPGRLEIARNVQLTNEIAENLLKYINPIFANVVNVSGLGNFTCERLSIPLIGGSKNDIEVAGTIGASNLRIQASNLLGQLLTVLGESSRDITLTVHPTPFYVKNGLLRYDNMQVDVGDNPINFAGVIGLDKTLNMTVTLPYTIRGRTVRTDGQGAVDRITLPLRGTIDKPQLDLNRFLEGQLKKQLEDQLRRGLEDLFK